MTKKIADEIQAEQDHGRSKYGSGPKDFKHDDYVSEATWHECIATHNRNASNATPIDRRQHLVKVAGLAVSAIEAFDRQNAPASEESKMRELVEAAKEFAEFVDGNWVDQSEIHDSKPSERLRRAISDLE